MMKRFKRSTLNNQSGQILVEYILLLLIAVSCATILTKGLVGRRGSEDDAGIIIKSWHKIITAIGNDLPDCPNQTNFESANCP
jgi:hypothetical protein